MKLTVKYLSFHSLERAYLWINPCYQYRYLQNKFLHTTSAQVASSNINDPPLWMVAFDNCLKRCTNTWLYKSMNWFCSLSQIFVLLPASAKLLSRFQCLYNIEAGMTIIFKSCLTINTTVEPLTRSQPKIVVLVKIIKEKAPVWGTGAFQASSWWFRHHGGELR